MSLSTFLGRLTATFAPARSDRRAIYAVASQTELLLSQMTWLGDPDEVLSKAGLQRKDLRALEGDDEITAALETRRDAVINTPWRLEPDKTRAAKFVDAELRPHIEALLRALWAAVPYGYAVVEVVYANRGGKIGIERIHDLPFEHFVPTHDGVTYALTGEGADPRKFFACVRHPSLRNPRGEALLSRAYWPWFFRKHGWQFWMKYLERCGVPFIVGKTDGDKQKALEALQAAVQDSIIVGSSTDSIEALDFGRDPKIFTEFEIAVTRRIQKLILGQTLTSGTDGGSGNRALGEVHDVVRQERKRADVQLLSAAVQRIVDQLAALNGWAPPRFVMEDDLGLGLDRAQRDKLLVEAGILSLTEEYLLERYDFNAGDFTVPERAPVPQGLQPSAEASEEDGEEDGEPTTAAMSFAPAAPRFTPSQQAVERLGDAALAEAGEGGPIALADIRSAVMASQDETDLADRLAVLLDRQDPRFADVLARAQFAGAVLGYVHAEEEAPSQRRQEPAQAAAPQTINLNLPEGFGALPTIQVVNQIPEAQPPTVNVTMEAPEQPAPVVNVNVPEQPTPAVTVNMAAPELPPVEVNVNLPTRKTETTVERDMAGNIVRATQIETDAGEDVS